jgi:hypothetical protein
MIRELWPWVVLAGLGAYHGLNPAMGWLFAVALGLHRQSTAAVLMALPPIAFGHLLSITIIAAAVVTTGLMTDVRLVRQAAGLLLIGWALYHHVYGHRHRVRVGMTAGAAGLVLWSFLMATAHGAGLMLVPALVPLCLTDSPARGLGAEGSLTMALAAVSVHSGAMLAVTAAIAFPVYRWIGLSMLRKAWINTDLLWTAALAATGLILLLI